MEKFRGVSNEKSKKIPDLVSSDPKKRWWRSMFRHC